MTNNIVPVEGEVAPVYKYILPYRRTIKTGALTDSIAVCLHCGEIVRPKFSYRSRTHAHGEDVYIHYHPLELVLLEISNSGKRKISVSEGLKEIEEILRQVWIYEGGEVSDVENTIKAYLRALKVKNLCGGEGA